MWECRGPSSIVLAVAVFANPCDLEEVKGWVKASFPEQQWHCVSMKQAPPPVFLTHLHLPIREIKSRLAYLLVNKPFSPCRKIFVAKGLNLLHHPVVSL